MAPKERKNLNIKEHFLALVIGHQGLLDKTSGVSTEEHGL